jgi:hypothetical protein
MQVVYDFDGGTPGLVEQVGTEHFRFLPYANQSGCQWFHVCVRVDGLAAGQRATVEIKWPPIWRAEDCPPVSPPEQIRRWTTYDSFSIVAVNTVVRSPDGVQWTPIEGVSRRAEDDTLLIPTKGNGAPVMVATQCPYRLAQYVDLIERCRASRRVTVDVIGRTQTGFALHAVRCEAAPGAPTVYVQAYQHATEFSGPLVADAMLRRLMDESVALPAGINFHFVPVVDLDALVYGMPMLLHQTLERPLRLAYPNPNREWRDRHWPEVAAIRNWITRQVAAGTRYVVALDLHNGWYKASASGATYTVAQPQDGMPADYIARQKAFVDHMYARTDHQEPGSYWQHATGGVTFATVFPGLTGGALAYTLEFSRHMWWDRAARTYVAARPEFHARFAVQALDALGSYGRTM